MEQLQEDVAELGLESEIAHLTSIRQRGASAHHQLRFYKSLCKEGQAHKRALREVARWLQARSEAGDFVGYTPGRSS